MLKNKIICDILNKSFSKTKYLQFFRGLTNAINLNNEKIAQADIEQEWQNAKSYEEIPYISSLKLIKNILPGGKYYKLDVAKFLLALKDDLGSIYKLPGSFGQTDHVITHNVQDFEKLYRNEGSWPKRPGLEALAYHRLVHRQDYFQGETGLLASCGEQWGQFRTAVNPVLMHPKNVRLYLRKMSQVNNEFIERIREIRDDKTLEVPSNFEEEINRWTFESVAVVALDQQLRLIKEGRNNAKANEMLKTLFDFVTLALEIELKPSLWRYIRTPTFNKLMKSLDSLLDITDSYITSTIERLEEERRNGIPERAEHEKSVLEKLLKINKKTATVMALDILMAGVDTTTSAFVSILLLLAKNPDKQAKLREEVMRILPQKDSDFTEEACKHMPYLRACIKESMRYYPITVGNARSPVRDIVLSGYRIPKDTRVTMVTTSLLCDENNYPRPNDYLPERWLRSAKETCNKQLPNENSAPKSNSPFIFLPFGFGPRTCIGRRIVEMELEVGIARLVRNFYIEYNYPTENAFTTVLMSMPNIPLKFKFTDVKE